MAAGSAGAANGADAGGTEKGLVQGGNTSTDEFTLNTDAERSAPQLEGGTGMSGKRTINDHFAWAEQADESEMPKEKSDTSVHYFYSDGKEYRAAVCVFGDKNIELEPKYEKLIGEMYRGKWDGYYYDGGFRPQELEDRVNKAMAAQTVRDAAPKKDWSAAHKHTGADRSGPQLEGGTTMEEDDEQRRIANIERERDRQESGRHWTGAAISGLADLKQLGQMADRADQFFNAELAEREFAAWEKEAEKHGGPELDFSAVKLQKQPAPVDHAAVQEKAAAAQPMAPYRKDWSKPVTPVEPKPEGITPTPSQRPRR